MKSVLGQFMNLYQKGDDMGKFPENKFATREQPLVSLIRLRREDEKQREEEKSRDKSRDVLCFCG